MNRITYYANCVSRVLGREHALTDHEAAEMPSLRALQLAWQAKAMKINDRRVRDGSWKDTPHVDEGWYEFHEGRYEVRRDAWRIEISSRGIEFALLQKAWSWNQVILIFLDQDDSENSVVFANPELIKGREKDLDLLWEFDGALSGAITAKLERTIELGYEEEAARLLLSLKPRREVIPAQPPIEKGGEKVSIAIAANRISRAFGKRYALSDEEAAEMPTLMALNKAFQAKGARINDSRALGTEKIVEGWERVSGSQMGIAHQNLLVRYNEVDWDSLVIEVFDHEVKDIRFLGESVAKIQLDFGNVRFSWWSLEEGVSKELFQPLWALDDQIGGDITAAIIRAQTNEAAKRLLKIFEEREGRIGSK